MNITIKTYEEIIGNPTWPPKLNSFIGVKYNDNNYYGIVSEANKMNAKLLLINDKGYYIFSPNYNWSYVDEDKVYKTNNISELTEMMYKRYHEFIKKIDVDNKKYHLSK